MKIHWPSEPDQIISEQVSTVYDGDTLHVFGRFRKKPVGDVELQADMESGETLVQRLPVHMSAHIQPSSGLPGIMARMAAAFEIKTTKGREKIALLGVKYQLMSQYTNYLVVDVKREGKKAE